MKNSKTIELAVGLFVLVCLLGLAFLSHKVSQVNKIGKQGMYSVSAKFTSVSGLNQGASVMMAGVKIGYVESILLESDYRANVIMKIDSLYDKIPQDSSASILTAGLLGEKYVGLDAGGFDEYLQEGDVIDITKSAFVIERLIDQLILAFSKNSANNTSQ